MSADSPILDPPPSAPREVHPLQQGQLTLSPTEPFKIVPSTESAASSTPRDARSDRILKTLSAYRKTLRGLLAEKFSGVRGQLPRHLSGECRILVVLCPDGMIIRSEPIDGEKSSLTCVFIDQPLERLAPSLSNEILYVPSDPAAFRVPDTGPTLHMAKRNSVTGAATEIATLRPKVVVHRTVPASDEAHPSRPRPLAVIVNRWEVLTEGERLFSDPGPHQDNCFIARTIVPVTVPWCAVEVYPLLPHDLWNPELAASWAELDILTNIAANNAKELQFCALDGRLDQRRQYAALLKQFAALLDGPEEPVHQFLRRTPYLLCPTYERVWSKLPFGDRVSDFVILDPKEGYILVEIEAPVRPLMRKDGHPRAELTHAIAQVTDWIRFIQSNRPEVENRMGLRGIAATPRAWVVIGRSREITAADREYLRTQEAMTPGLRVLTYDDVLRAAKVALENLVGPLDSAMADAAEVYYYTKEVKS